MPKLRVVEKKAGVIANCADDLTVLYDDACGLASEVFGESVIVMIFDNENFIRVKIRFSKEEIKTLATQFATVDRLLSVGNGVVQ